MEDSNTKDDLDAAFRAIASIIGKTEKAGARFAPGTSQHTLQKNRLLALKIAASLVSRELSKTRDETHPTTDFEKARAPLASLISKSEKSRQKLAPGTWQYAMLNDNLKALDLASQLLNKALHSPGSGK
jgi:hypothetical protein